MSVTKINYSAIYVVMATVFVLVVHTVDPTAIVGVILAILIPMLIILGFCNCFGWSNIFWFCICDIIYEYQREWHL